MNLSKDAAQRNFFTQRFENDLTKGLERCAKQDDQG